MHGFYEFTKEKKEIDYMVFVFRTNKTNYNECERMRRSRDRKRRLLKLSMI